MSKLNSAARNLGRCFTTIVLASVVLSCGGGGAVLEPDQTVTPGNPPAPTAVVTTPGNAFSPEEIEFASGGTVTWQFSGTTHNVTFKDLAPPGGNIPNSAAGTNASRTFPIAGDYDYFCTIHDGMKGRIRVR